MDALSVAAVTCPRCRSFDVVHVDAGELGSWRSCSTCRLRFAMTHGYPPASWREIATVVALVVSVAVFVGLAVWP